MHARHRRCVASGRRDGAPEGARERTRAQHEPMARTVFPASRHVWRAHRANAWRERVAGPGGASRPGMPGARCRRGMECPANGTFFSRCARLMAGRRRQDTQWRRPRVLAPPALPNGGLRRGGSNVGERFTRAGGRIRRVRSERAPVAGKGRLVARAVCPARPARGAHHAPVRPSPRTVCAGGPAQSGRIARGPYLDRAWERAIVGRHDTTRRQRDGLHRQRAARSGRGSAHGERPAGRDGGGCGGAGGGGWAARAGATVQGLNMHVKTIAWCCFQVTRVAVARSRGTLDNCLYRESVVNSSSAPCSRVASAYYIPDIRVAPYLNATF